MTIEALRSIEFDGIFAFKFSPRQGTKAAEMEGSINEEIKPQRLNEILGLQDDITLRKNEALKGTLQEVLVEVQVKRQGKNNRQNKDKQN